MSTYDTLMVDIGNAPNDDQGDPLRTAFDKINQRFAELRIFVNNRGDWQPNTAYTADPNRDWVIVAGVGYLATSNHTSGATFAADLAAGKWVEADAVNALNAAQDAQADVDALRADLASTASGKGAELVGFSYAQNYAVGTLGWSARQAYGIDITQAPYSADPTGLADAGPAIAAAAAAFPGVPLCAPAGTYRIATKPNLKTSAYDGVFGAGFKLFGAGILKTYFVNDINNDAMFEVDSDADHAVLFRGAMGVELEGFTVKRIATTEGGTAIRLRTCYNAKIRQVHIIGMSGDGIHIPCAVGDNDGSNMVDIEHVRIENCAGWGIDAAGDSGFNETSFLHMKHVFIQACGTNNAAYQPPTGGMRWKGQILTMQQVAFTINENCALFIPGAAGLGQNVDLQNTTFENNKKRGLFCRGVSAFKARNIQFYNNDAYTASVACEFEAGSYVIRQVDIDGVVVRATAGNNAYTAFKISGANVDLNSCRVRRVVWDNFDYAGQTRFDGWQFDPVNIACDLVAISATSVLLRPNQTKPSGNTMPLRLRGGAGGTPSSTGEWVAWQIPNTGISISNASLAASTRYYAYLFDNNGAPALELSTTAFAIDTSTGYPVKTGDATRIYCGSVITNGSSQFATTAGGWLNPMIVPSSQPGTYTYMWTDSSGKLRVRYPVAPSSDTDGTVVGTQT